MLKPAIPDDEKNRITALNALKILDTSYDESYDRITRLTQALFSVPICLVSLVDTNRQWFKSCIGLPVRETGRDISFCGHAILGDEPFIINDASKDERFADNPLVTAEPHIRFYGGLPLKTLDGSAIGTLCIIDREPRSLSEAELVIFNDLGEMVERELHNRELALQVEQAHEALIIAREKAEAANQAKTRFLANISHELRTPMHAILSFTALCDKKSDDEKIKQYLSHIKSSGQRLMELVSGLLDIANLESGKMIAELSHFDIASITREQIEKFADLAANKKISLTYTGADELSAVFDKRLMIQVLHNLIDNAVKYSAEESAITLTCESRQAELDGQQKNCIYCAVQDNGAGIPAQELEDIFDRFTEGSNTRSNAGGKGLGLSLCKEIIKLHKGVIRVTSPVDGSDSGSVFEFMIPTGLS